MTALSIVTACGDDGATVTTDTDTETETDPGDDDDDDDDDGPTVTMTDPDPDSSSSGVDTSSSGSESSSSAESSSSGGGELCGNSQLDDGETCDGALLARETCESLGHLGGELACADDCSAFDESGCFEMDCGDGVVSGDEECDDDDLARQSCESLDFDTGELACNANCTFDTSACVLFSCGDGAINDTREECDIADFGAFDTCESLGLGEGTVSCTEQCTIEDDACCGTNNVGGAEVCDGTDLNGGTCAGQGLGFDGGVLACAADCNGYETTGCTTCGDDVIEGTEECEGADLQGNDCTSVGGGFVGGTLGCDASCGFDTTGCNFCGNDLVDVGEDCDGAALGTETCVTLGNTGGVLGCAGTCDYDTTGCTNIPLPEAGEVVITEIMMDPLAVDDALGEYIELHNPSLVESFQLLGCVLVDNDGDSVDIEQDLVIDAGAYLSLARSDTPGFTPDYIYGPGLDFQLANGADEVRLVCNGTMVDEVVYDGGPVFPDPTAASMQLDPGFSNTTDNDLGENWCESFGDLGNGDLGTPGAANVGCFAPTFAIDFCNLQFPLAIDELEGTQLDVFGRLYIAGLTDATAGNDPAVNVLGWVGYGPDGSDPALDATWTWIAATPNPAWMDPAFPASSNDEYMATFSAPVEGTYDYAYRFSGDGGTSFTYCDSDGTDETDAYEIANAGAMETHPAGDPSLLYFSEYLEGALGGSKAVEIYNPGPETVFLDQCIINRYTNGAAAPSGTVTIANFTALNHNVASNDVFVICVNAPTPALSPLCDGISGSLTHTGNDVLELVCNGVPLDVIGQIGNDPVTEWSGGGVGTANEDLRRDCAVTAGDPDGTNAFDPSIEWDTFLDTDFTNLGIRGCP